MAERLAASAATLRASAAAATPSARHAARASRAFFAPSPASSARARVGLRAAPSPLPQKARAVRCAAVAAASDVAQVKAAREDIRELLRTTHCHPILVRLGWHDAGTYDKNIEEWPQRGGANGSLRFDVELKHGANAGLINALKLIQPMPLVGCPRRGPLLSLVCRHRRSLYRPRAVAPKCEVSSPPLLTRRVSAASLLLAVLPIPVSSPQLPFASASEAEAVEGESGASEGLELERYTDQEQGFTFLKPTSWPKVEKAGATALFQQEGKGSNNIGVVVNPVRLNSLTEFGTPQFVADRLLQAEKKKESTKSAEVISVGERSGHGGLTVYEIEYTLDSTRGGMKRIFSGAFVASRKLYLLNIAYSDTQEKPLDSETRIVLEKVLHSFDSV